MRVFHDSRDCAYRAPYGAVTPGTTVMLALDVEGVPGAKVELRTWADGQGESLYPMDCVAPTRFEVGFTPDAPGVVWYHFIITSDEGWQKRYGMPEGKRGGSGCLYDWEPPSFQLTVCDGEGAETLEAIEQGAIGRRFSDVFEGFLCGEVSAFDFAEACETLRENSLSGDFLRAVDLLGSAGEATEAYRVRLLARLAGVALEEEPEDGERAADFIEPGQLGLAKGRLWCASLIQLLAAGLPAAASEDDLRAYDELVAFWGEEDADCEAIVRNAADVRLMLPLFAEGKATVTAVNGDVIAFWCHGDEASACVLVNASLYNAYDVPVPMVNEEVSEVIGGYGVPVVDNADTGVVPTVFADADRYARVHLYQLGTAILYFHGAQRLERAMQPGLGVLAHITSLPANGKEPALGTLGESARSFVDWLADAGVRYWQILPVNPTDDHGSPYAGISAFAGNVRLLEELPETAADAADAAEYAEFCEREADWLEPYACFMAIREKVGAGLVWQEWPKKYLSFDPKVVEGDAKLSAAAERWRRGQFEFERQWRGLRAYANERGVQIVGDMPIYVSSDSSDVWANPQIFQLGADGNPDVVAGCPPDAFAVEGQVWGNPVYDWDALRESGYNWWLRRLERAFDLYDVVRLDHFIGFARYFSIPAGEKALAGSYRPGPGLDFFRAAYEKFGPLPVIAEDLGSITPCVRALVAACGFPGMDIVQFVDGGDPLSGYHPRPAKIAYTGTHDNQTVVGYCEARYPELDAQEAARDLVQKVVTCEAPVRVLPLQDVLGLGDEARMNEPGTTEGNWVWQADADAIAEAADTLRDLVAMGERPSTRES